MKNRVLLHIGFWLVFVGLDALVSVSFAGKSDLIYPPILRFLRFFANHLIFLPWKIIPFYVLFYWLGPRFLPQKAYLPFVTGSILVLFSCVIGYRLMIEPVSVLMYNETPSFNSFDWHRLFFTFMDILPAIAIASSIKLIKERLMTQKREQRLLHEKTRAELKFLKAQMNPHFLFNTLNNIFGLARRQDACTPSAILKLSNIMRYILHECSVPSISIEKEILIIEDFIALEKLRFDDSLQVQFDTQIDNFSAPIAPLILLPFVENAFKHGASESRFNPFIYIKIELARNKLKFHIENSVEMFHESENGNLSAGIGLQNVKRQLDLIYPGNHKLRIDKTNERFLIELKIDLTDNRHEYQT